MNHAQVEILLVEDDQNDAKLTIRALTKSKMINNLIHLNDGAEALDFLYGTGQFAERDPDNFPKVILLDLKMPKVDGWEVLKKIKSDEKMKKIPVVVLTSSKESPDIDKCYALGANSYIVKPVVFENFVKAVQEIGFYWLLLNQP